MRPLLALLAAALLSIGSVACGTSSKGANSVTQPSPPGGSDNNIPAYGHEASASDKRAVTVLVKRYYAAAAANDGSTACSLLYSNLANAVPEDYGKPPGPVYARGKTCAVVMSKVFEHLAGRRADLAATKVTDVRIYRDHGFAELRSTRTPKGEIFVERQGRSWRVGALIGRERSGP